MQLKDYYWVIDDYTNDLKRVQIIKSNAPHEIVLAVMKARAFDDDYCAYGCSSELYGSEKEFIDGEYPNLGDPVDYIYLPRLEL